VVSFLSTTFAERTSSNDESFFEETSLFRMVTAAQPARNKRIETDIPLRLDRLPWSKWHTRIIIALGTSWLLDGLEVTLVGSLSGILGSRARLSLTDKQVTGAATAYLAGSESLP
jgi:hypothetical protein